MCDDLSQITSETNMKKLSMIIASLEDEREKFLQRVGRKDYKIVKARLEEIDQELQVYRRRSLLFKKVTHEH